MQVTVRLFAVLRDTCGTDQVQLECPPGATLQDVVDRLRARFPRAEALSTPLAEGRLLLARNRRHARPDEPVADGDEVALFPPVSGGRSMPGDEAITTAARTGSDGMKALVLLSGGIDSPVALYELIQDGWDVAALHMDNRPFTDDTYVEKVRMLVEQVERVTGRTIPLYIADHGRNQTTIARTLATDGEDTTRGLQCVLCKRQMYRTAEAIANEIGAHAIATGESLGQVASQTMHNLAVEDDAITFPMVRPLLGLDKEDIIEVARRIGTFEISTIPSLCCSILPDRPATHASLERVLPYERRIGAENLLKVSLAHIERPRPATTADPPLPTTPTSAP